MTYTYHGGVVFADDIYLEGAGYFETTVIMKISEALERSLSGSSLGGRIRV